MKSQSIGIDMLECIFVDDASTDDGATWNVLKEIEKDEEESVIIIQLENNMKQGGARNIGIDYATGEYLMFLDSDDVLRQDACELLYNYAEIHHTDIIQFNHIYVLGEEKRITKESRANVDYSIKNKEDRYKFLDASTVTYGCTNKFFRLSLIHKAQARFAEKVIYEEPLFVYPCFLYAKKVSLITEALYYYIFRDESTVTSMTGIRILDHPQVQLELLRYCLQRTELFKEYRNYIELYFIWSYYCETLYFASQNPDAFIPLIYYKGMQEICETVFGDWRSNPLIKTLPPNIYSIIDNIDHFIETQEELENLIHRAGTEL